MTDATPFLLLLSQTAYDASAVLFAQAIPFLPFLNQPMLLGFVVVVAPFIIHLFNKRRFRRIPWGAMQFLRASMSTMSRRIRMENFFLMLLRMAMLAILVLAFARPFFTTRFTIITGLSKQKVANVILLDSSLSMHYVRDGKTNFDRAKAAALDLIGSLRKGDTVSVFTVADETKEVIESPALDFERAKEGIKGLTKAGYKNADFLRAFDVVIRHMKDKLNNPVKEVFVLTDLRQSGWSLDRTPAWTMLFEQLKNTSLFPVRPGIHIIDVSNAETEDAAVVNLSHYPRIIGPGRDMRLDFQVMNYGRFPRETVVSVAVDSIPRPQLNKPIQLQPDKAVSDHFLLKIEEPGSHVVSVEIGEDALPLNNKRHLALNVLKNVPVLIVNGAPSLQPFKGETDFLAIALSPRMGAFERDPTALAEPQVRTAREFSTEDWSRYSVIILANVDRLAEGETQRLEQFVSNGGGLLIFLGDLVDTNFYNNRLFQMGTGLLPTSIGETQGNEKEHDKFTTVAGPPYSHPSLIAFRDASRGDLTVGHIWKWYRLDQPTPSDTVKLVASLAGGSPWLVEKQFGRGRVMLCATPCDTDWCDFPIRKFYVPLMHELVYYLASGSRAETNVAVGAPLVYMMQSPTLNTNSGLLRLPNGQTKQPLEWRQEGDTWKVTFGETNEPGVYQFEVEDGGNQVVTRYAVNFPMEQFNLAQLTIDQQKALTDITSANVTRDPKEIGELAEKAKRERFGIEIWRQMAYILLALLFVELLVTSHRTKSQHVEQTVKPEAILNR